MSDQIPLPYLERIPHYHGDTVRQLFIAAAVLILLGAAFYGDFLAIELPLEIVGVLFLVTIAALANPHNKSIFLAAAAISGAGLVIYETWALFGYAAGNYLHFALREVIAVIFFVALYFALKTVRAFALKQVGKHDEVGEFDEEGYQDDPVPPSAAKQNDPEDGFDPWVRRNRGSGEKKKDDIEGPRMSPGRDTRETMPQSTPYDEYI